MASIQMREIDKFGKKRKRYFSFHSFFFFEKFSSTKLKKNYRIEYLIELINQRTNSREIINSF